MYVEVDLSVLKPAITRLAKIVSTRSTLPVLENILIEADENLTLTASNLERCLTLIIPARVHASGKTTVSGKMLSALLSRLHGGELTLLTTDGGGAPKFSLYIPDGPKITLPAIDADEFPPVPSMRDFAESYTIDGGDFRSLLYSTYFCYSKDEARPILEHVNLEFSPDKLTVSSTDGTRLANKSITLESSITSTFQALVPGRLIDAALKLLPIVTGEPVTIGFKHSDDGKRCLVMFSARNARIAGSLYPVTNFPDWRVLIAPTYKYEYKFDRKQLLFAMDFSLLITGKYDSMIVVDFPNGKLSAKSEERGVFECSLPDTAVKEPAPFSVGINNNYLIDGLRHLKGDVVTLLINDNKSHFMLKDETGLIYVCMPMFLG